MFFNFRGNREFCTEKKLPLSTIGRRNKKIAYWSGNKFVNFAKRLQKENRKFCQTKKVAKKKVEKFFSQIFVQKIEDLIKGLLKK